MNFRDKIIAWENLPAWRATMLAAGKKLVVTNGCFDILHLGHVTYLEHARNLGDALLVGLTADAHVRALKGAGRPIMPQRARAELLAGLAAVDYVVIFNGARATQVMRALEPDVYVKGGDYSLATLNTEERGALEACKAQIRLVKFKAGYSTSAIVRKIKRAG